MIKLRANMRVVLLLLAGLLSGPSVNSAEPAQFSIVLLPDTQVYSRQYPDLFFQQTSWIAANARALNIRFVTHVGDIVDKNDEAQWTVASRAMSALDGIVPWSVAIGNHDCDVPGAPNSAATAFLRHFGPARFAKFKWYRGASPNGLNSYAVFRGGAAEMLILHLEQDVPDDAIRWAEQVLKSNPGRPAILVTHVYLQDAEKTRTKRPYLRPEGNSGEQLWQKFIRRSPQIFMVLCGHYSRPGEWHQVSVNDSGNKVIEMLADYQLRPNGGDGWLNLISFDVPKNCIEVKTYSPVLNRYETDDDSQFTLPLPIVLSPAGRRR